MKKWLRRALIAVALVAMTLAGLYEYATHVGRGWLRGEAVYEGRPTSYWRSLILQDLETEPDELERLVFPIGPPSVWDRCRGWIGMRTRDRSSIRLLSYTHDSNDVLVELQ